MRKMTLLLMILFCITGCSSKVLLPYEEDTLCDCEKNTGYCGSVTDIYNYVRDKERGMINEK